MFTSSIHHKDIQRRLSYGFLNFHFFLFFDWERVRMRDAFFSFARNQQSDFSFYFMLADLFLNPLTFL